MRLTLAVFLWALALVGMTGVATSNASQSSDPPGKLEMWQGRWNYSGQIYETSYSHAHSDSGTVDCNWMPNRGYMVCNYYSDDPPHDDLLVMNYSPAAKAYTEVHLQKDAQPSWGKIAQNGNRWIISSVVPDNGKKVSMRIVVDFPSPDKQTTTVQVSANKGQSWTKIIETSGVRLGNAG